MGYGAHGAGVADSEGHARNQTEPTEGNTSDHGQLSAVRRRRVARRLIQRARRKEFRQHRSDKSEGRIDQLESQVTFLLEQIASLQLQVVEISEAPKIQTCMSGTQTIEDDKKDKVSATTQTKGANQAECGTQATVDSHDAPTQTQT